MERSRALEAFLAGRDVPCHACGYNLRDVQGVFCPECGVVIPLPSESRRARRCRCGYDVRGLEGFICPECGASLMDQAALGRRERLALRAIMWLGWAGAVLSIARHAPGVWTGLMGGASGGHLGRMIAGVALCLGPTIIWVASSRLGMAGGSWVVVLGLVCVGVGAAV